MCTVRLKASVKAPDSIAISTEPSAWTNCRKSTCASMWRRKPGATCVPVRSVFVAPVVLNCRLALPLRLRPTLFPKLTGSDVEAERGHDSLGADLEPGTRVERPDRVED